MRPMILLLLLLAPLRTRPSDWSKTDTTLEATLVAVSVADYLQTRHIASHCLEANPILGSCPSNKKITLYFTASIASHIAIAAALPKPWRTIFQVSSIGWEGRVVSLNIQHGF